MIQQTMKQMDWWLVGATLGLVAMGLIALYSTSQPNIQSGIGVNYFAQQMFWVVLGIVLMAIIVLVPYRWFFSFAYPAYFVSLLLLIAVYFVGIQGFGATRWLKIGFIRFQPSELAKFATLLALAKFLSNERLNVNSPLVFLRASALLLLPFLLIFKQPDLGTSMVFVAMALPIFFWAGLSLTNLILIVFPFFVMLASFNYYAFFVSILLLVTFLYFIKTSNWIKVLNFILNIAIGLITPYIWANLHDYQRERIRIFLNPEADPLGAGYQIIQSKVAIGSGGLFGKGFLHGSQTQLRFLPQQHTDFIFTVIGEEFGFIGALVGLMLFGLLLYRLIQIARMVKSRFHSIVTIGVATIIAFHMIVNLGMIIGMFPVTGLPLPFVSYGGSALLTNLLMVGAVLNFYRNRFEY